MLKSKISTKWDKLNLPDEEKKIFDEMLESLVGVALGFELSMRAYRPDYTACPAYPTFKRICEIIEKATGLKWEQIREVME